MRKVILGLLGLIALALPQAAAAQDGNFGNFGAFHRYSAKFLCGYAGGAESRLGVVQGHYNTVVNLLALKNGTRLAFSATALSSDLEVDLGVPSFFSPGFGFDSDEGMRIVCRDVKNLLIGGGSEGFVEGFVTIYSSKPIDVEDVLTGEASGGEFDEPSVMQVYKVTGSRISRTIRPEPLL